MGKWWLFLLALGVQQAVASDVPFVVVLGIGQDGGLPQLGREHDPAWSGGRAVRTAAALGLVDPRPGKRWLFEATPDIRTQMHRFEAVAPRRSDGPFLDGIFLTHAHIGHYTGLMFLGHESMGADAISVWAMSRMREYLSSNGPWDQLVRLENIKLEPLAADQPVSLGDGLTVTPFLVPHRQEYSEVVGFRIIGPNHSLIFIPDIDSWTELDALGVRLEDLVASSTHVLVDATFFDDGEIPGRDMSGFPHPRILTTMDRLQKLPDEQRGRVRFIHLNHTNPALDVGSAAYDEIIKRGFRVAAPGDRLPL